MKVFIKILLFFVLSLSLYAKEFHEVTDMIGRKVTLPVHIEKIVTLGGVPPLNSFLFALGEGGKIINGLPSFVKMPKFKYMLVFDPSLKNKVVMQTKTREPKLETILQAKPDLVLTFSKADAKVLSKVGVKTVVLTHWRNEEDVERLMSLLGRILGKEKRAKEYISYFKKTVAKAKALTANVPKNKRPTVLYTVFRAFVQPVFIADWWIKAAGGISVSANRKVERLHFGPEQLLKWNPDVIVVTNASSVKELESEPRFARLKAVVNHSVYPVPKGAHIWAHLTTEQPLTILWLLHKLYPKKLSQDELIKEVSFFYKKFYNTQLSKDQILEILSGNPR